MCNRMYKILIAFFHSRVIYLCVLFLIKKSHFTFMIEYILMFNHYYFSKKSL